MKTKLIALLVGLVLTANQTRAEEAAAATPVPAPAPSRMDTVAFKGDIRIRGEYIDKEGSDTRERARIRVRFGTDVKVSDEIDATIALASGEDDPVSTNQTLGDGFSSKQINLDLAYINLHPDEVSDLNILLGKMKQPFIAVNDLQWDSDLNPEGAALNYEIPAGDTISLLLNGGAFWVEERSSEDETMLYGTQAALQMNGDELKLTAGASYFFYDNIEGYAPIYDPLDSFGNSVDETVDPVTGEVTDMTYATGFEILELFTEAGFNLGAPVVVSASYVVNQDADDDDTGYMVGLKVGKLKKVGSCEFGYSYRELEANAVLGVFADSDSFGGGTDGKTHKISLGYQIAKNLSTSLTYYTGQAGLDDGVDYDRVQLDLSTKF